MTTYGEPAPRIDNCVVSYSTSKTIRVSANDPAYTGPFVVNVTSSQNITLVAMRNGTSSFGSYSVYPRENAGIFYDVVSFPYANESHQSEVTVIGVDDDSSDVTFTSGCAFTLYGDSMDSFTTHTDLNKTVYTATGFLNKTQMIVIRSSDDLTGATVVGSRKGGKVVVISGSYCPAGSCDVLMEQMPPIQTLGKSYFIVPTKDYPGSNCFRILAPWDNTMVTTGSLQMDTNTRSFDLNKGGFHDIDLPDGSLQNVQSIQSSNPILLMHYLIKSNSNVAAMTIIPPIEQYSSGNVTFTAYNDTSSSGSRPAVTNFINIITICDNKNYLRLNRQQISAQNWQMCPPFDDSDDENIYCATQTQLTKNSTYTLGPDSRHKDVLYSAVQYGIRTTDQSAFAHTVFMSFEELTCNVEKGGVVIPCKTDKPATPTPSSPPTTTMMANDTVMTTVLLNSTVTMVTETVVPTASNNSTRHKEKSTARQRTGTGKITLYYPLTTLDGINTIFTNSPTMFTWVL